MNLEKCQLLTRFVFSHLDVITQVSESYIQAFLWEPCFKEFSQSFICYLRLKAGRN